MHNNGSTTQTKYTRKHDNPVSLNHQTACSIPQAKIIGENK